MNSLILNAKASSSEIGHASRAGGRNRLIGGVGFATVAGATGILPKSMPLHFGKIFAAIALLTIGAFIAWLLFTSLFATEQAEQKIEKTGAVEVSLQLGVAA
jgi:hypothetical protein